MSRRVITFLCPGTTCLSFFELCTGNGTRSWHGAQRAVHPQLSQHSAKRCGRVVGWLKTSKRASCNPNQEFSPPNNSKHGSAQGLFAKEPSCKRVNGSPVHVCWLGISSHVFPAGASYSGCGRRSGATAAPHWSPPSLRPRGSLEIHLVKHHKEVAGLPNKSTTSNFKPLFRSERGPRFYDWESFGNLV